MKVIRLGSTHGSPSRYIDLLENKDIEQVLWIARDHDVMVESVFDECKNREPKLSNKLILAKFNLPSIVKNLNSFFLIISTKWPYLSKVLSLFEWFFILLLKSVNFKLINKSINVDEYDFVWSGNNDSDGTNILTWWFKVHYPNIPIIHSYQEHRCKYRLDEKVVISFADVLILPSVRNKASFENIYNLDLSEKIIYGNEDWRYSGLVDYVSKLYVTKKSAIDGEPHVIILSRFATYQSKYDNRRGSRINYVGLIRELLINNVHVHLNAMHIVRSIEDRVCDNENPYFELREEFPRHFHIDSALNLEDWSSYIELKSYDAGILHNMVSGEAINLFSEMNVPNRLFEYLLCDIHPIVIRSGMLDAESLLDSLEYGIVANDYEEVAHLLKNVIVNPSGESLIYKKAKKYNFKRFVSMITHSGKMLIQSH